MQVVLIGQRTAQGTEKADWQEDFSDGTDLPAQAGTREEVDEQKSIALHFLLHSIGFVIRLVCPTAVTGNSLIP